MLARALLLLCFALEFKGALARTRQESEELAANPYGHGYEFGTDSVYYKRRIEQDGLLVKKIPFEGVVHYRSSEGFESGAMPVPEEVHCLNILTNANSFFAPPLLVYTQDVGAKMHVLVMRDVPGVDLAEYLRDVIKDPLPEHAFKYILFQLVLAELSMLGKDITHGDLQAQNIYIDPRTLSIKITEFGLAQTGSPMPLGSSGTLFDHIAPERCDKTAAVSGEASEVFSLGVIAYRLLHRGRSPFRTRSAKFTNSISGFACVDCSEETKKVILSMLDADPDKRIRLTKLKDSEWLSTGLGMFVNSFV